MLAPASHPKPKRFPFHKNPNITTQSKSIPKKAMPTPAFTCVFFCGARAGANPTFSAAAQGWRLVQGTNDMGLMGEVAADRCMGFSRCWHDASLACIKNRSSSQMSPAIGSLWWR